MVHFRAYITWGRPLQRLDNAAYLQSVNNLQEKSLILWFKMEKNCLGEENLLGGRNLIF